MQGNYQESHCPRCGERGISVSFQQGGFTEYDNIDSRLELHGGCVERIDARKARSMIRDGEIPLKAATIFWPHLIKPVK